jgi:WD40 repeat protein
VTLVADGTAVLWSDDGEEIATLAPAGRPIRDAMFTANGAHVIAVTAGGDIVAWNAKTGAEEAALDGAGGSVPSALRLSADGTRLLTARDGTVTLETIALPH